MALKTLLLLPLLPGASASWTTTIKTNLIVPNTLTPVVEYVTGSSSLASQTSTPASFNHALSHQQHFTTVVTVPDGSVPTIHFSAVTSTSAMSIAHPSSSVPGVPQGSPSHAPSHSTPIIPSSPPAASTSTTSHHSSTIVSHGSTGSSAPPGHPSPSPVPPSSFITPSSSPGQSSSTAPPGSTDPSTSPGQQPTSSGESTPGQSGSQTTTPPQSSSIEGVAPSDQVTSVNLASASDLESLSADFTGSETAIVGFVPTGSPTSEAWGTSTSDPTETITGTPSSMDESDASEIAALLRNSYNNIDDLKDDPTTYKKHIEDIKDKSATYLSDTSFDSSTSPCSGSKKRALGKRDLFGAIGNLASEAADATVDTAIDIAGAAISCVAPIADKITSEIPDTPEGVTDDIQSQIQTGTQYFATISNIVGQMEQLKNDETESSSQSDSSTESSTSTSSTSSCTSSTTYSDCTWSTIISSTPGPSTATLSTTSTEICETRTACDASPTTVSTTSTVGVCSRKTAVISAMAPFEITPSDYSETASPGSSGSTSVASSTTPPGSVETTSTASPSPGSGSGSTFVTSVSSTRPPNSGSSTTLESSTTPAPSCRAYYYAGQKDDYTYCQFDCDAYTGKYPIASSPSGMSGYQPCPYSTPPSSTWTESNAGEFITTATDGTVYECDDSRNQNAVVNNDKTCVTSMSSVTVISSIYESWSSSKSSESASSASEASASSASAAAATPTDGIDIYYSWDDGSSNTETWVMIHIPDLDEEYDPCDTKPLAAVYVGDALDHDDIPNPSSIDFSEDADVFDDEFKDCKYDADSATLNCPDFTTECDTDLGNIVSPDTDGKITCVPFPNKSVMAAKVRCAWGEGDMKSS